MWPFERMSLSRSGQSGFFGSCFNTWKYSAAKISAMPKGPAVCPEPAAASISMTVRRIASAFFSTCATSASFIYPLHLHRYEIETGLVVQFAYQGLRDEPQGHLKRKGGARTAHVTSYHLERRVAACERRVRVYHRHLVELRNIALEIRRLERTRFLPKGVLACFDVVVSDLDVLDSANGIEYRPVHRLAFGELRERAHDLFTTVEDDEEAVVYLYGPHCPLVYRTFGERL